MRCAWMSIASIQAWTNGIKTGSAPGVVSTESNGAASCRRIRPSGVVMNSMPVTVPTRRGGLGLLAAAEGVELKTVQPVRSPTKKVSGSSAGRSLLEMSSVEPARTSAAEIESQPESLRTMRPAFLPEGTQ